LNVGGLFKNIGRIMGLLMKLSSSLTLMPFIVVRGLLGLENPFNELVDEL